MNLIAMLLQAAEPVADAPAKGAGGSSSFLIMMLLIFVVMYFLMIRPQQKKQKEMAKFRSELKKGDKVVTAGGIYGTIKEVKENYILLDVDNNVSIRIDKGMVMKDSSDLAGAAQQKK